MSNGRPGVLSPLSLLPVPFLRFELQTYDARVAFLCDDEEGRPCERSSRVLFAAENEKDAVESIWRWIANRQRAMFDYFGKIGSVKIGSLEIDRIASDGQLLNRVGVMSVYEWKYDWGGARDRIPIEVRNHIL